VAVAVNANPAQKVRASPVLRATHRPHHAATAHKAHRVLKGRAMVAVTFNVKAVADKSSAAIRVLTTAVMAKAVPHHAAHVLKAVDRPVAAKAAAKSAAGAMATNCLVTSTR
jgi:hypothetical protein